MKLKIDDVEVLRDGIDEFDLGGCLSFEDLEKILERHGYLKKPIND